MTAMVGLIIGHTDHQSVKIWIKGDRGFSRARVALLRVTKTDGHDPEDQPVKLNSNTDYTHILQFNDLAANCEYNVNAEFRSPFRFRRKRLVSGRFRTFPDPDEHVENFSFVLGSCNLSTIKVNNLLGLVAGLLGQRATDQSLKRKPKGGFRWLRVLWRLILRLVNGALTFAVNATTGYRQTGTPLLTSPFLRLSELYDITIVPFERGKNEPAPGCHIEFEDAAGIRKDHVSGTLLGTALLDGEWERRSGSHARGFLRLSNMEGSFEPGKKLNFVQHEDWIMGPAIDTERPLGVCERVIGDRVYFSKGEYKPPPLARILQANPEASGVLIDLEDSHGTWKSEARTPAIGLLELTEMEGRFDLGDRMFFSDADSKNAPQIVGTVAATYSDPPAFMIHSGDQIYFDFPFAHKVPTLEEYRLCYKQSWFEDDWAQNLFGRCPHYMSIDDHEIVDNYARDFEPRQPKPGFRPPGLLKRLRRFFLGQEPTRTPELYSKPALQAYHEYVNTRHPDTTEKKFYYEFEYGGFPFFVMDARTERYIGPHPDCLDPHRPGMISEDQYDAFEEWLTRDEHRNRIKFLVSSVPFVAQVRRTSDEGRAYERGEEDEPSLDKWSAAAFRRQREAIIELIHKNEIQNLVVLAGDVHCCYHATMRIGHPRVTGIIHELAAGPIYQLRTGNRSHFFNIFQGKTGTGCHYRSQIDQLHGGASAAMKIRVINDAELPRIDWEVIRTISPKDISNTDIPTAPASGSIIFEGKKELA